MNARVPSIGNQYLAIFALQSLKVRGTWLFHVPIPAVISFGLVWFRARLGPDDATSATEHYVAGAAVIAALFSSVNAVAFDAATLRERGELEYISSFPVKRQPIVMALVTLPMLIGLAPVAAILLAGRVLLDVRPTVTVLGVAALLCVQLLFCSIGVVVGLYLPPRLATSIATTLPLLLMVFSPILIPVNRLPYGLQLTGGILPTTLATDILEQSMFSSPDGGTIAIATVLAIVAAVSAALAARLPGWRETA